MTGAIILAAIAHALAAALFGWLVFAGYRYVAGRSGAVATIFAVAVLVRAALGLGLFLISYLRLPIAESLQLGGGFWQVFLDASGTHQNAAYAAESHRLFSLDHSLSSPVFLNIYTLWLMLVGISPVAGLYLNLCIYAVLVVLLVRFFEPVNDWRCDLPCIVAVGGYSFAPVTLIHSTQPLKEELSVVLVGLLCLLTLVVVNSLRGRMPRTSHLTTAAAIGSVGLVIFSMAGVRWYFSFIMWCAVALTFVVFAARGRVVPLPRYAAGSVAVLSLAWLAIWAGAGQYYAAVAPELGLGNASASRGLQQIREFPSSLLLRVRMTRTGFLTSGGGTNIVIALRQDPSAGEARVKELNIAEETSAFRVRRREAAEHAAVLRRSEPIPVGAPSPRVVPPAPRPSMGSRGAPQAGQTPPPAPPPSLPDSPFRAVGRAIPVGMGEEIKTVAWGLGLLSVPISLLQAVSGITVSGGRGLLHITDLDTVFLDVTVAAMVGLVWTRRRAIRSRLPIVVVGSILSVTTAVLLGYSVTNFGTLWRMRPMAIIPLWVMAVALPGRVDEPQLQR